MRSACRAAALVLAASLAHAPAHAQQDGAGATEAPDEPAPVAAEADSPIDPSSGVRPVPEGVADAKGGSGSDYPTVARADYVLGCMAANGNDWAALQQCSCSIDYIRERMDWQDYDEANTILQVQLDRGQRGIFYRDSNWAKTRVDRLQALQAESSLRCF